MILSKTRTSGILTVVSALLILTSACDRGSADDNEQAEDSDTNEGSVDEGPPDGNNAPGSTEPDLLERVRRLARRADVRPTPAAPVVSDDMWVLGQALAFDKILSGNRDLSCMTCHHPAVGTDDDRVLPSGIGGSGLGRERAGGAVIPRNAPQLFNLHTYETMFWDGRVERQGDRLVTPAGPALTEAMQSVFDHGVVSAQAMFPVISREEMRGASGDNELASLADDDFTGIWAALMERIGSVDAYPPLFEAAYPGQAFEDMSFAHAANAIAAFEIAAYESINSPWDRMLAGDDDAMTVAELRGAEAFFDGGCGSCHRGVGLSDFRHHNIGMPQFGPGKGHGADGRDDFGRAGVTGDNDDRYAFRTPPLFNVDLTSPYGHAGQFETLERHIEHYDDARISLGRYDIEDEVSDPALWLTQLDNQELVLRDLSRRLRDIRLPSEADSVRLITLFMHTLTDEDASDLSGLVPDTVPSGLPVED